MPEIKREGSRCCWTTANWFFVLHDHEWVVAALKLFRAKPSLGFSDCLMLEMARKAGQLPLGTFDGNLGKIVGDVWKFASPGPYVNRIDDVIDLAS